MPEPGVQEPSGHSPFKTGRFDNVVFTIGVEAADVINVGVQLKNGDHNIAVRCNVKAYLSDDANGDSLAAAAASGGVAIGTDGLVLDEAVANKVFDIVSEADGNIDLDITEVGVDTWFLIVVLPDGSLVVSTAITFA